MADANETYYYHFDGLGSVVALSDVNNVLVERYAYDVFGQPTIRDANGAEISETAVGNPYLFTGRRYDAETALYYYRARYYDYYAGRFIQPDPLGYIDGLNLYAYVGNRPTAATDPLGQRTFHVGGTGMLAFGFAGTYSRGYIFDAKGVGVYRTYGVGAVQPPLAASGTITIGGSNASTMENFSGPFAQFGGAGPGMGAEVVLSPEVQGFDVNFGPTFAPPANVEFHGFVTHTEITRLFNYSDILENPGHVAKAIGEEMSKDPVTGGPALHLGAEIGKSLPDSLKYGPFGLGFDLGAKLGKWLRGDRKK